MLFEHACDVSRYATVSGATNGRKSYSVHSSGIACLILPMDAQTTVTNNFSLGRGFSAYFPLGTDVKTGDKLAWNGLTLHVKGTQSYATAYAGHIQAACEQEVNS